MAIVVTADHIGTGAGQDAAATESGIFSDVRSFLVTGLQAAYPTKPWMRRTGALRTTGSGPNKIPVDGSAHPDVNISAIVLGKTCRMIDDDAAVVTANYGQPDVLQWDAQLIQGTETSIGTTSSGVQSNIDGTGATIITKHDGTTERVQSISAMESMSTIEHRKLQNDSPWADSRTYVRSVNDAALADNAIEIGCLYCQSITGQWVPEAQQWIASYTFVYRAPYTAAIFGNEASPFQGWEVRVIETDPATGQPYTKDKWAAGTVTKVKPYPLKSFSGLEI